jgi:hypothetical protein
MTSSPNSRAPDNCGPVPAFPLLIAAAVPPHMTSVVRRAANASETPASFFTLSPFSLALRAAQCNALAGANIRDLDSQVSMSTCVAAIALVLGFTQFNGNQASNQATKPSLRLISSAPLKVRGAQFRPRESVRLTAGKRSLQANANGDGYFVATIPGGSRCDTLRVLARGSAGSYAVVKLLPQPACMPARSS